MSQRRFRASRSTLRRRPPHVLQQGGCSAHIHILCYRGRQPRTVVLDARYDGHIGASATVRIAAGVGLVGGSSASFYGSFEAAAPAGFFGNTCPRDVACVRPVAHVGLGWLPYSRNTSLMGPGSQVAPDASTAGTLMALEVGGGLTILPPGTGDRFRATVLVAGLVAGRTEERDTAHGNLLLSPATTVLGAVAELVAGVRLFDGFMVNAGVRVNYVPTIGSAGRQFSYLGNAQAASSNTSLVSVGLIVGLGIEL